MATTGVVLVGKTGTGKSLLGNNIIRKNVFEVLASPSSVTAKCQSHRVHLNGTTLMVVDTPGLFDTGVRPESTTQEMSRCISMTSPGPHIFLFVMRIGRLAEEEVNSVRLFFKHFGKSAECHTIFVFTRADELHGKSIQSYLSSAPSYLQNVIKACGNRIVALDNKSGSPDKVQHLLQLINSTVKLNRNTCYTNAMYQENIKLLEKQERELQTKQEEEERRKLKQIEKRVSDQISPRLKSEESRKRKLEGQVNGYVNTVRDMQNTLAKRAKMCTEATRAAENLQLEIERQEEERRRDMARKQREAEERRQAQIEAAERQHREEIAAREREIANRRRRRHSHGGCVVM